MPAPSPGGQVCLVLHGGASLPAPGAREVAGGTWVDAVRLPGPMQESAGAALRAPPCRALPLARAASASEVDSLVDMSSENRVRDRTETGGEDLVPGPDGDDDVSEIDDVGSPPERPTVYRARAVNLAERRPTPRVRR